MADNDIIALLPRKIRTGNRDLFEALSRRLAAPLTIPFRKNMKNVSDSLEFIPTRVSPWFKSGDEKQSFV
jgi:hypothetical protein